MHERKLLRRRLTLATLLALLMSTPSRARGEPEGSRPSRQAAAMFQSRCTACHTYGKGVKVGPDLKGVTGRRERRWLVQFIRGSSSMIASGDRTAAALFAEFKQQRMPDWAELSEKQVEDILDYLASGGPEAKPLDERSAEAATPADVELGRRLFDGAVRFADGGQPCSACHTARGSRWARGGSLGPDLTAAYLGYQDRALTSFLRRPCMRWEPAIGGDHHLSPAESFALKAFLRESALPGTTVAASTGTAASPAAPREPLAAAPTPPPAAAPPARKGGGR